MLRVKTLNCGLSPQLRHSFTFFPAEVHAAISDMFSGIGPFFTADSLTDSIMSYCCEQSKRDKHSSPCTPTLSAHISPVLAVRSHEMITHIKMCFLRIIMHT